MSIISQVSQSAWISELYLPLLQCCLWHWIMWCMRDCNWTANCFIRFSLWLCSTSLSAKRQKSFPVKIIRCFFIVMPVSTNLPEHTSRLNNFTENFSPHQGSCGGISGLLNIGFQHLQFPTHTCVFHLLEKHCKPSSFYVATNSCRKDNRNLISKLAMSGGE